MHFAHNFYKKKYFCNVRSKVSYKSTVLRKPAASSILLSPICYGPKLQNRVQCTRGPVCCAVCLFTAHLGA